MFFSGFFDNLLNPNFIINCLFLQENCSIWTLIFVVQDAIGNQNGMFFLAFKKDLLKLYHKLFFFTGKLFYLDTDIGGTGCYCKPEWNVYYWKETNECFEQESPGPCPTGQYFAYNSTSRSTECNCFKNFVYDPTKGIAFQLIDPIIINLKYAAL